MSLRCCLDRGPTSVPAAPARFHLCPQAAIGREYLMEAGEIHTRCWDEGLQGVLVNLRKELVAAVMGHCVDAHGVALSVRSIHFCVLSQCRGRGYTLHPLADGHG
jgi:hypothetical protein